MPLRIILIGFTIILIIMGGCVLSPEAKLVKQYRGQVDRLMGRGPEEVIALVKDKLKFELFSNWSKLNPTPELAFRLTRSNVSFSRTEAKKIFKENGYYDVLFYKKKCGEGTARLWDGEPDMYLTFHEHPVEYAKYVVLRMVFLDKKLHDCHLFHLNVEKD